MSNLRAEMRRKKLEEEKNKKKKKAISAQETELLQAINTGQNNGQLIAVSVIVQALHTELGWQEAEISDFSISIEEQFKLGDPAVIECAVTPWRNKIEKRIEEYSSSPTKMVVKSAVQSIEYRHRNLTYLDCCALMFLNLYSNFNLSSNNKKTGKLDKIIEKCVVCWYDFIKNPFLYSNEQCIIKTKEITGVDLLK